MPGWLTQLLDARTVVGFVLGIAAATIAILVQARVEHGRWLRQQRLEAFAAFLSALDAMQRPATRWQLSWATGDSVEMERFFDQLEALDRIGGRIHLLSDPVVNRAAIDLLRQWSIEINSALKTHDGDRMARALDGIPPKYRRFIELARAELGQKREFLEQKDSTPSTVIAPGCATPRNRQPRQTTMPDLPPDPTEPGISRDEWRERVLLEIKYYRERSQEVPWQLLTVGLELRLVQGELERIAGRFQTIAELAAVETQPTVQILFLKAEVERLAKIIDETVLELVHKIAEVEAKSLG